MTKIFNKTNEKAKRRMLRKNMPLVERLLWSKLRGTVLRGHKFRRQYSIKNFIIDFYCPKLKLAIEVDGDCHFLERAEEYDRQRRAIIEAYGITFLRFTNRDIYDNMEGVLCRILEYIDRGPTPTAPHKSGERPPPTPPW